MQLTWTVAALVSYRFGRHKERVFSEWTSGRTYVCRLDRTQTLNINRKSCVSLKCRATFIQYREGQRKSGLPGRGGGGERRKSHLCCDFCARDNKRRQTAGGHKHTERGCEYELYSGGITAGRSLEQWSHLCSDDYPEELRRSGRQHGVNWPSCRSLDYSITVCMFSRE